MPRTKNASSVHVLQTSCSHGYRVSLTGSICAMPAPSSDNVRLESSPSCDMTSMAARRNATPSSVPTSPKDPAYTSPNVPV